MAGFPVRIAYLTNPEPQPFMTSPARDSGDTLVVFRQDVLPSRQLEDQLFFGAGRAGG